ncbi:hypothetical protein [Ignavibacterium sp.]|uniref:hypothetical protein n=1 Tax=Ignavibacterium sp. TaxID=2651167 RepID=UPI002638B4DB|nr:hypothetical protein [Ignavibacterium sp.]
MDLIIQIASGLLFILFAAFAEGIEWKERYLAITYTEQEKLNRIWHWLQFFERVFALLFGFSVGVVSGLSILSVKIFFLISVLFWIIYDAVINMYAKRDLFAPSKHSTSPFEKFYWFKPILLILVLAFILLGCGSTRVVEKVRIDTIKVVSPVIEDSLMAKVITDTVVVTNKIIKKDTVIDVRYYPVDKKFYLKVKPDTVLITKIDTVTQIKTEEGNSNSYKWIVIVALAIIGLISLIIIKIK